MPAPREEYRQLQQSLTEKVLDRAASDLRWRQRLLDEPEAAAMREANFPKLKRVDEMRKSTWGSQEEGRSGGSGSSMERVWHRCRPQ